MRRLMRLCRRLVHHPFDRILKVRAADGSPVRRVGSIRELNDPDRHLHDWR